MAVGSIGGLNLFAVVGAGSAIAFVVAAYFWGINVPNYRAIRRALRRKETHTPEEMLASYDAKYLSHFIVAAGSATVGHRVSALRRYLTPTLGIDIRFAIAFSAGLILGNLAIASFVPFYPYGAYLALFCAAMGAAYGISDIQEDRTLKHIFAAGPNADPRRAKQASRWTRLKFVTLFFAWPAAVGLLVKLGHDRAYDFFYGALKLAPFAVLIVSCVWSSLARVLWACRVSVLSALAGYYLFLSIIQAQDLFADTTYGGQWWWHVAYWTSVFAAVAFIWALPVHYAARAALEGNQSAWYVDGVASEGLIHWTPRILGVIPVVAVLLGVFGAAVETRYAMTLDHGLPQQFVLLSLGGWFTLGFVVLMMVERRNFVERFLNGPNSRRSQVVVWLCAGATSIVFLLLVSAPLHATQFVDRAALTPFLLGSGVLLFGLLSRLSDRIGIPILGFGILGLIILTASNAQFNEVRSLTIEDASELPHQMSLPDAVKAWRIANRCNSSDSKTCPPALIVAADGGASRAAYFSAAVVGAILDRLANPLREDPSPSKCADPNNPARCLFAFSGVSGGSLGLVAAKAALLDANHGPPCAANNSKGSTSWRACLEKLVLGDYLSPVFVGLTFRDQLAPPIYPFTDHEIWGDRAVLFEKAFERHYLAQTLGDSHAGDCAANRTDVGLCRPFATERSDGQWTPLLLLNGTSVQTGRRVITSEIRPIWTKGAEPQILHQWAYDLFDILGADCGSEEDARSENCASLAATNVQASANIRLSTAAVLSARFPIISPAGHVHMRGKDNPHGDEIVDGGYFENSGLSTALDVATGLRSMNLTPLVVSISNNPTVEKVQAALNGRVEAGCRPGPLHLDVRQAESDSIWVRAVEILYAPLAALLHTRDGHADEAGGALKERLYEWDADSLDPCDLKYVGYFPIRVYAEGRDFAMPDISMSWWLSPVVQKALDRQLDHPRNIEKLGLLLQRLSREGCLGCDSEGK